MAERNADARWTGDLRSGRHDGAPAVTGVDVSKALAATDITLNAALASG